MRSFCRNNCESFMRTDIRIVMGKWYVVEVIEHRNEQRQGAAAAGSSGGTFATSMVKIDACPIVKLRSIERPGGPPRFSLLWEENAGTLEYTFWVSPSRGRGVWNSDVIQNGTLADKPTYKQFVGTVHVMKAVASHMVLTFCTRDTQGQRFSVLVAREHKLPKIELQGVHKLLERRKLQLLNIRESCTNGSAGPSLLGSSLVLLGLVYAVLRNNVGY
ncbi:uncharacterized protein LOC100680067 isoform X2 [Nasonia vitripennis]|uniref:Uncharacterized protein n=1 Tax=Nasonia vitripennis TaxID=7425 RepID=A0A7M7IS81_NASVI|nr:uncharacterized protein LOC100680067 isoform X2 [Nasonia vitripennis]